jgi:hypothetical protein
MIFSENRFTLFRIMLWQGGISKGLPPGENSRLGKGVLLSLYQVQFKLLRLAPLDQQGNAQQGRLVQDQLSYSLVTRNPRVQLGAFFAHDVTCPPFESRAIVT